MTYRLTLFHSLSAFVVAYMVYFHDAFSRLWNADETKTVFVSIAVYIIMSVYMAIKREKSNFAMVQSYGSMFPAFGLAGSAIGMAILLHSVGGMSGVNAEAKTAYLIGAMSTVLSTTITGILLFVLLWLQRSIIFGEHGNE